MKIRGPRGFTLIELMIVVAIIGILAAIAIPKFAELIRKSEEGSAKGNLGRLRSALSIYYGDMEGQFPSDNLASMTVAGKYLTKIPAFKAASYHASTSRVRYVGDSGQDGLWWLDEGQWGYWSDSQSYNGRHWGDLWVACHHTDTKGNKWTTY